MFQQVTTKPDLYPLVFSCNNSDNGKNGASYLMVQYFRNYIVRPVGSLSATSTVDSLSSSFICNANEANTLIPPPYSRAGSPLPNSIQDYASMPRSASQVCSMEQQMQSQRSIPVVMTNQNHDGEQVTLYRHYHDFTNDMSHNGSNDENNFVQFRRTPNSVSFQQLYTSSTNDITNISISPNHMSNNAIISQPINNNTHSNNLNANNNHARNSSDLRNICDVIADAQQSFINLNNTTIAQDSNRSTNAKPKMSQSKHLSYSNSTNGFFHSYESIETESNNYVLNMPVNTQAMVMSTPTGTVSREFNDLDATNRKSNRIEQHFSVINEQMKLKHTNSLPFSEESPVNPELLKKYNIGMRGYNESMSGSAVSSLANIDSPASPPRATSPTGEIRELLEQIRQLQQNANSSDGFTSHDVQSGAATTISNESSSFGNGDAYDGDESSTTSSKLQPINKRPSSFQQNRRTQPRARFFPISTAKTLRSPLGPGNLLSFNRNRMTWMSKSAPTTPGTTIPTSYLNDDSPLLNEHDEDAEQNT